YIKYKNILKNNIVFFVMFLFMIIYIVFLSNIIFSININTSNLEIEELVRSELSKNNISLYKFVKSFEEKEKIKNKILNDNKSKLEWLEITRHGSSYNINVLERIKKDMNEDKSPSNIVAKKNAIILSIDARSGSIVKKLNDYVKQGEVIISGEIIHKENIVDKVKASGTIYGETWYNVHVSYPVSYYDKTKTGNITKRFHLKLFNKDFIIGGKYKNEDVKETKILFNKFTPIKLSFETAEEVILIDDLYTVDEAYEEALKLAREKLLSNLPDDSEILNQKKLKLIINNSTIDVDIFFKVYENITEVKRIEESHE
ncbi:MAG: sporulation protein YqfD, partial [Bacilli bacterium]|nr:sporulation protein YqfD [Bacilli bacterium]